MIIHEYDMIILNGGLQPYLCIITLSTELLHYQVSPNAVLVTLSVATRVMRDIICIVCVVCGIMCKVCCKRY